MSSSMIDLLSLNNPVFCTFAFWSGVLAIKMFLMSPLTAFNRFRYKIYALLPNSIFKMVFPNPEDAAMKNVEVQFNDPNVERVRRAHRNDMENILPYFTVGMLYICIDPNPIVAVNLFRVASIARIIHTLVYAFYPVPQPTRAIAFFVQLIITIYMALHVMYICLKYI